jgi:hypothetical protein
MPRFFFYLLPLLLQASLAQAQLVISEKIELADTTQQHVLWTSRGDQLRGQLLQLEGDSLYFKPGGLRDTLRYHRRELSFVGLVGEPFPVFSLRATRYRDSRGNELGFPRHSLLYSATALPPENRGSYRNNLLLINEVEFNLNQHFSFGAGAIIPPLILLRAQARVSLSPLLHLSLVGNHYISTIFDESYTHPYLALTIGTPDTYINFTYGRWFQHYSYYENDESFPMITIGCSHTLNANWRIFFEGMLFHDNYDTYLLPTGYFNYLRRRSVYGFGLWGLPAESSIPMLPWLSYSYLF